MKVVLYARVSTTRQAERDLSIPDQLKQLRAYCSQHGHEVVREYREEGASATDDHRPVFKDMMDFALDHGNRLDAVLVLTSSRFFRDALGARWYKHRLKKEGVRVISITQEVKDDPTGTFVEGIFELQDQYESQINGYHTLRGMRENARQGYFNGSKPPFGYRAVTVRDAAGNKKTKLAPDESESGVIRRMFDLYVNGLDGERIGIKRLTGVLNREGSLYRGGVQWSKQRVQERLSDPLYIGQYFFNKRSGKTGRLKDREEWILVPVEPVVDVELFEQAERLRRKRAPTVETPPSVVGSKVLLTGLLVCGRCGARMSRETAKGGAYQYYNCANYLRKGRGVCEGNRVPVEDLERQILDHLAEKLFARERVREIILQVNMELTRLRQQNSPRIKTLKKELEGVRVRVKRHYEAIESGSLDLGLVADRLRELKEWEAELQEQLEKSQRPKALPPYLLKDESLAEIQARLRGIFLSNEREMTKKYLEFLLERVEVMGDEVNLVGNSLALCNFALARKTEGTVNHLATVPTVDQSWLPGEDSNLGPSG